MEQPFRRIGILGVGLIGGSLGQAIRKATPRTRVVGFGRDAAHLRRAKEMGAVDDIALNDACALKDCDLVILATPIEHILSTLETLGGTLAPGTLVTDAGSTKRRICRLAWRCFPAAVEFIGGHPVAGREVTGVEHSVAGLFRNAPYILCPRPEAAPAGLERLKGLAAMIGARPLVMTPEEHDRAVARISHLPQLLSTALANISDSGDMEISGSGLRDMLRLAGSSYSVWQGVLDTNSDNIQLALEDFIRHLQTMRQALHDGSLSEEFDRAGVCYRKLKSLTS